MQIDLRTYSAKFELVFDLALTLFNDIMVLYNKHIVIAVFFQSNLRSFGVR